MEFLNKPMSEVWKATKKTFNDLIETSHSESDLIEETESGQGSRDREFIHSDRTTTTITSPENPTQSRYRSHGKTASLPRLQKASQRRDSDGFHIVSSRELDGNDDVYVGGSRRTSSTVLTASDMYDSHANSRSRGLSYSVGSGQSISIPRNRYRSNSSDRASMRNRNEEAMVNSNRYQRSTSYDKAMDNAAEEDEEEDDQPDTEKMKTKLMSMWNNMKYGWTVKSKTAFSYQKPIWLLGKCYQHRPSDPEPVTHPGMDSVKSPQMELFKQDFTSRLWMTYRRDFPMLDGSTFTTDCGWGCMLRSAQMLLAQCLVTHFMGRDWNFYKEQSEEMDKFHHEIIRWFGDQPLDMSPFSIHRLVDIGKDSGKKAGDWYGPASVAHIMRDALHTAPELNPLFEQLCVYVAQDCTVYKQDVIDLCQNRKQDSPQPVYKDRPLPTTQSSHHKDKSFPSCQGSQVNSDESFATSLGSKQTVYKDESSSANQDSTHNVCNDRSFTANQGSLQPEAKDSPLQSCQQNTAHVSSEVKGHANGLNYTTHIAHNGGVETVINGHCNDGGCQEPASSATRLPPANTLLTERTECRDNIAIHPHDTQTSDTHPGSERAISHNSFGYSANFNDPKCTYTRSQSLQSSESNPKAHNTSGYLNRTKSENGDGCGGARAQTDEAMGSVEFPLPRRNAVRENKQCGSHSDAYSGIGKKAASVGQSSKTYTKMNYGPSISDSDFNQQDLATPECNTETQTHEPLWRRQSAERIPSEQTAAACKIGNTPPADSKETEINGYLRQRGRRDSKTTNPVTAAACTIGNTPPSVCEETEISGYLRQRGRRDSGRRDSKTTNPVTTAACNIGITPPPVCKETEINSYLRQRGRRGSGRRDSKTTNPVTTAACNIGITPPPVCEETEINGYLRQRGRRGSGRRDSKTTNPVTAAACKIGNTPPPVCEETEIKDYLRQKGRKDSKTTNPMTKEMPYQTQENPQTTAGQEETSKWCSLILLVPVRLGGDEVNPIYVTPLRALFTLKSCMGIIGGKPKHSLYYVGFQDDRMIHLDPHYCQPVVDMKSRTFPTYSFHCMSPRKMRITNMDPSCTVGFYLKTEKDFEEFCQLIPDVVSPSQSSGDYPMFIVRDGRCTDWQGSSSESSESKKTDRFLRIRHIDQDGRLITEMKESEDFVFLDS